MFTYKTELLNAITRKIILLHPNTEEEARRRSSENALASLLNEIAKKDDSQLKSYAGGLKKEQLRQLCGCFYKIDDDELLRKVLLILYYQMTAELMLVFYQTFQNCYESKLITNCMRYFSDKDSSSQPLFELMRVSNDTMRSWLNADSLPRAVAEDIKSNRYILKNGLEYYGIREESELTRGIKNWYYKICTAQDYENTGEIYLTQIINRYDETDFDVFILNFIEVMSDAGLRESMRKNYGFIVEQARKLGITLGSSRCKGLFSEHTSLLEEYTAWVNYYSLLRTFEADKDNVRIAFWQGYIAKCRCTTVSRRDNIMLLMDFGGFYAVEFSIMGPVYLLTNFEYENCSWQLAHMKEHKLKHLLKESIPDHRRIVHVGYNSNWQSKIGSGIISLEREYGRGNYND